MLRLSAPVIFSCISLACGGNGPTAPSQGAVITFRVVDETFRVHLLDERQIAAALQAAAGGRARIPNGRVVAGTGVNVGWSWHLEDVEFAEQTIEVCDGRPSDVEREGTDRDQRLGDGSIGLTSQIFWQYSRIDRSVHRALPSSFFRHAQLKTVLLMPTPSARHKTVSAVNPGLRTSPLKA